MSVCGQGLRYSVKPWEQGQRVQASTVASVSKRVRSGRYRLGMRKIPVRGLDWAYSQGLKASEMARGAGGRGVQVIQSMFAIPRGFGQGLRLVVGYGQENKASGEMKKEGVGNHCLCDWPVG